MFISRAISVLTATGRALTGFWPGAWDVEEHWEESAPVPAEVRIPQVPKGTSDKDSVGWWAES